MKNSLPRRSATPLAVELHKPALESFDDTQGVAVNISRTVAGGVKPLALQAECGFHAYGEMRLKAEALETPAPGIDARERGMLMHKALELVWLKLGSHFEISVTENSILRPTIADSVAAAVVFVFRGYVPVELRQAVERETHRLEILIEKLLDVERTRAPFTIETLEARRGVAIGGGQFELRIDRIDAIEGGGYAILDYKSGEPRSLRWNGEVVRDPQLLAYLMAERGRDVVALANVSLANGRAKFTGKSSHRGLLPGVSGLPGMNPNKVPAEQIAAAWQEETGSLVVRSSIGRGRLHRGPRASAAGIRRLPQLSSDHALPARRARDHRFTGRRGRMSGLEAADAEARERALDVGQSFVMQAPAGSGKTTVLTQRYLKLLTTVDEPEQVLAITFTRKAAGEMRERVQKALDGDFVVRTPADALTLELGAAVRAHAARRGWGIEDSAARLRIQTIDAFNSYLANSLPITSQSGFGRGIADAPDDLYAIAARETLRHAESDPELRKDFELILRRLDDSWRRLEQLIAGMLSRRAEWLPNLPQLSGEALVPKIEASLAAIVAEELAAAAAALPPDFIEQARAIAQFAAQHVDPAVHPDVRALARTA